MTTIAEYCIKGMLQTYGGIDIEDMADLLGIKLSEDEDIALEEIIQEYQHNPKDICSYSHTA